MIFTGLHGGMIRGIFFGSGLAKWDEWGAVKEMAENSGIIHHKGQKTPIFQLTILPGDIDAAKM